MIIFILLILVIIGLIAFNVYNRGLLNKEHLDELNNLYDEIFSRDEKIKNYEETITLKKTKIEKESEEILNLNNEMKDLKEKLSSTIKENNSKIDSLNIQLETKDNLLVKENKKTQKLEKQVMSLEKKLERQVTITEKKQAEIDELVQKEIVADRTIDFLKKHMRAPSMDELKAYTYEHREVLKRMKKQGKESNNGKE